jgi:hypothetical protein
MTPLFALLMAVLSGPGNEAHESVAERAEHPSAEAAFAALPEARETVKQVLRDSNRARGRDAADSAPAVVAAYRRLAVSEKLPAGERRRLQAQLHTRLSELQNVLRRREQRTAASHAGGVVANAQELINLIQTTIAPDTWAINGGQGTIYYYPFR